jgi:hypothetical protein
MRNLYAISLAATVGTALLLSISGAPMTLANVALSIYAGTMVLFWTLWIKADRELSKKRRNLLRLYVVHEVCILLKNPETVKTLDQSTIASLHFLIRFIDAMNMAEHTGADIAPDIVEQLASHGLTCSDFDKRVISVGKTARKGMMTRWGRS